MKLSKAFLGLFLVLLVAVATTVEAVELEKETKYCRHARKECQDKCKDMDMMFKCRDEGEGARAAACSCSSKGSTSSHTSSSSSSSAAAAATVCSAAKAT